MMPESFDLLPGNKIGDFTVNHVAEAGAYGKVYRIADALGENYALKVLKLYEFTTDERALATARFSQDFRIANEIDSVHVVKSFDSMEYKGNPAYRMEWCDEGSVESIAKLGLYVGNWEELTALFFQVLHGLDALHSRGMFHRDLKEANVLKGKGVYKISDFGTSVIKDFRITKPIGNLIKKDKANEIFGTIPYMSPEVLSFNYKVGPQIDVYSLGVMMYHVITGKYPYDVLDLIDESRKDMYGPLIDAITNNKGKSINSHIPNIPEYLVKAIEGCLEGEQAKRYKSVKEIIKFLEPYINKKIKQETKPIAHLPQNYNLNKDVVGLRVQSGVEPGRIYNLNFAAEKYASEFSNGILRLFIGRSDPGKNLFNHLVIVDNDNLYISRKQATLELKHGNWYIYNGRPSEGNSKPPNSVQVNFEDVSDEGKKLKIDDIISLAGTQLILIKKN